MDINLTGFFWGWPYNLTGQATGHDPIILKPVLSANMSKFNLFNISDISNFNVFNFSGQATASFASVSIIVAISIVAVISIMFIVYQILIKSVTRITPEYSKILCNEYSNNQNKLSVYSRLCGQRILTYNYNRSYWNSLTKGINDKELIEKIIASNKDLIELIALALVLFPGAVKKSVEDFGEKTIDILWMRKRDISAKQVGESYSDFYEIYKNKRSDSNQDDFKSAADFFEKYDNELPELKKAIKELDRDIRDLLEAMKEQIGQISSEKAKPKS